MVFPSFSTTLKVLAMISEAAKNEMPVRLAFLNTTASARQQIERQLGWLPLHSSSATWEMVHQNENYHCFHHFVTTELSWTAAPQNSYLKTTAVPTGSCYIIRGPWELNA